MKDNITNLQRFSRIQNFYVFSLAKGIYFLIAIASLFIVIFGIIFVVYLRSVISSQPSTIEIPPSYQKQSTAKHNNPKINLDMVSSYLEPPNKIEFIVTVDTITTPLRQDVIIGYFTANTKNHLAAFPDGISIIGGHDAESFEKVFDSRNNTLGLKAKPVLINEINELLHGIKNKNSRNFDIRVTARDQYGMTSPATNVSFVLNFGPESVAPLDSKPETKPEFTELQKIAGDIAKTIEPTVNPKYFGIHRAALGIPSRCGTNDSDNVFISNYRNSFDKIRSQLNATNLEAFYVGLCEAWRDAIQRELEKQERIEQEQAAAYALAEEKRAQAQTYNYEMLQQHKGEVYQAKEKTTLTLSIMGGALTTFLLISIILAFMALESHSRAIREAMESMVKISEEKRTSEVA